MNNPFSAFVKKPEIEEKIMKTYVTFVKNQVLLYWQRKMCKYTEFYCLTFGFLEIRDKELTHWKVEVVFTPTTPRKLWFQVKCGKFSIGNCQLPIANLQEILSFGLNRIVLTHKNKWKKWRQTVKHKYFKHSPDWLVSVLCR